jgi:hypothetical protein
MSATKEHDLISRNEHEFRMTVLRGIADLSTGLALNTQSTENIVVRLDTLNGSVAKNQTRIGILETKQATDEAAKIATAQALLVIKASYRERKEQRQKWIVPIGVAAIIAGGGALLAFLLLNGPAIVKFFKF